jgi:hypothetical protein
MLQNPKLSTVIAFTCYFLNLNAQTYYPMPTNSATWTVVEYGYGTFPPETGVTHFGLSGDTIINGFTYHKLFNNLGGLGFVNPDSAFNLQTALLYGVFREDSSKKVWFRKLPFDTIDILTYNFALNLGDTFCFNDEPCGVLCHPVSLVDSILINGSYRRQIHFNYDGQEETWIEGIGSKFDNWIGKWCFIGNISWFLNCYSENGFQIYGNCDYPTDLNELSKENYSIKIFPNPVLDFLTVENGTSGATISVENLIGENILFQKISSDKTQINLEFLIEGIYVLRYRENKHEMVFKLVKH